MFGTPRFDAPEENQEAALKPAEKTESTTVSSRLSKTAPQPARNRARRLSNLLIAFGLLTSLAAGYLGGYLGSGRYDDNTVSSASLSQQKQIIASEGQLISSIAKSVGPSVVSVNVMTQSSTSTDFFGFSVPGQAQEAAGTGIVISSEGVILTNRHVVPAGVTDVSITLSDGTQLSDVKVLGRTSSNDSLDVAFLKVNNLEGHKLTPAVIGDSGKVQIGDTVVAIGNALGQFNNTVTSGIISGHGRSVVASDDGTGSSANSESLDDLFQTDAAINQGNSGGPLVNVDGQVIGINTAVSGQGQNIGFAIPINDVNGLVKQVLSTGKFERPYLGVRYVRLTADTAKQYKLNVNRGAYVVPATDPSSPSILPDSPAAAAGVQEGDIITEINGTKIDETNSLTSLIGHYAVGETVKLKVLRDGKTITLNAKLAALPAA
jgi:serine protease Do